MLCFKRSSTLHGVRPSHSLKPQQKHLCGVLQCCMLPEAEQLSCARDVGSARALVPGTIARGHTYMAYTTTISILLLIIIQ